MEYKAKLADYDQRHQAALDEGTLEGKTKADYIAYAKQAFQNKNPYGSEGNHPGFIGKLEHGLAKAGNIAGNIAAPGLLTAVPGSDEARARAQQGNQVNIEKDQPMLTAQETKDAKVAKADQYDFKESTDDKGNPVWIGINKTDPSDVVKTNNPAFVKDAEGKPSDQDAWVNQALKDKQLPDTAENRKGLISEYSSAHQAPTLVEHQNTDGSITYEAAKAGTTVAAPEGKVGSAAAEQNKFKGKNMYFDTPEGRVAYTAEEAKAAGLDPATGVVENEGQVSKDRDKNSTYNVINKSLDQYQKDLADGAGKITPDDVQNLMRMTQTSEGPDYLSKIIAGAFDDIMGHPVTGYSEELMKGTLDKNTYQDMSPAARKVVADYYSTMMAHFANMKASQGTIPRNPYIIKTEMQTIPQPYLSPEEASEKFKNYKDQVAMRNSDNVKFPTKKGEEKTEETAAPKEATHIVQGPDGKMHYTNEAGTHDYGLAPATK
jgi:hypothetical protein